MLHFAHSEFPPTKGSPAWLPSVLPVRQPIHESSTAIGHGCFHDRVASKPTGSVPKNSPSEPKRSRFVPTFPVLKMLLGTCHSRKNYRLYIWSWTLQFCCCVHHGPCHFGSRAFLWCSPPKTPQAQVLHLKVHPMCPSLCGNKPSAGQVGSWSCSGKHGRV